MSCPRSPAHTFRAIGTLASDTQVTREPGPVKGGQTHIAFVEDPTGYKWELIQRERESSEPLAQVMLRVTDLEKSIKFYEDCVGMKLLRTRENKGARRGCSIWAAMLLTLQPQPCPRHNWRFTWIEERRACQSLHDIMSGRVGRLSRTRVRLVQSVHPPARKQRRCSSHHPTLKLGIARRIQVHACVHVIWSRGALLFTDSIRQTLMPLSSTACCGAGGAGSSTPHSYAIVAVHLFFTYHRFVGTKSARSATCAVNFTRGTRRPVPMPHAMTARTQAELC